MAWRRRTSRRFYPRNLILKWDHSACILSVDYCTKGGQPVALARTGIVLQRRLYGELYAYVYVDLHFIVQRSLEAVALFKRDGRF